MFNESFWMMNPMTAEEIQQQKLRELLIEVPSTPDAMRTFLSPESLAANHLPFPATDFNLPKLGMCCCEELEVSYSQEDLRLFVNCMGDVEAIAREDVTLAEWLGLWLIMLNPGHPSVDFMF